MRRPISISTGRIPGRRASAPPRFALSIEQLRRIEQLLKEHELDIDVLSLIEFIKAGIEGREYAKFVFTRSLSDALSLIRQLGEDHGLSAEDCAFLDYDVIRTLYSESGSVREALLESVARGRERYALTRSLVLPPIIASPDEVFAFHLPPSQPNFITRKSVTAPVASVGDPPESFAGQILFVPSADPGFDWIFTRGISGFVTQFGGANSHMAIRAGELGIPAVIGAGETLFQRWQTARTSCASIARIRRSCSSHESGRRHPAGIGRSGLWRAPRLSGSSVDEVSGGLRAASRAAAQRHRGGSRPVRAGRHRRVGVDRR